MAFLHLLPRAPTFPQDGTLFQVLQTLHMIRPPATTLAELMHVVYAPAILVLVGSGALAQPKPSSKPTA